MQNNVKFNLFYTLNASSSYFTSKLNQKLVSFWPFLLSFGTRLDPDPINIWIRVRVPTLDPGTRVSDPGLDALVLYKSNKNIYKLKRYSGAFTTSEKCLGPPGTPEVMEMSNNNIYKLERHYGSSTSLEKCLGPPDTPGLLHKSKKNIYKFDRYSGAFKTSEKCLGPPGTPGVL